MDNILQYLINLSIFIPFMVVLIAISIKLSKGNLESLGIYKYTKVIEQTSLNKDTQVFVLKIGDEGCVLISSPSKLEKIKELSKNEINEIEEKRKQVKSRKLVKLHENKINLKNIDLSKLNLKEKKWKQ